MDSALHSTLPRPELVTDASTLTAGRVPVTRALTATAIYGLSEAGRKASLLAGGNGRAVQKSRLILRRESPLIYRPAACAPRSPWPTRS